MLAHCICVSLRCMASTCILGFLENPKDFDPETPRRQIRLCLRRAKRLQDALTCRRRTWSDKLGGLECLDEQFNWDGNPRRRKKRIFWRRWYLTGGGIEGDQNSRRRMNCLPSLPNDKTSLFFLAGSHVDLDAITYLRVIPLGPCI